MVLKYHSDSGIRAGFTSSINTDNVADGHIEFSGSHETGVTGSGTAITITFDVLAAGTSPLDLDYSAMLAATSSTDLLPLLIIRDGQVVVTSADQYILTTEVSPSEGGVTNPEMGIHDYPAGTVITVTARPASGHTFVGWSGDCTGPDSCSVTMDANRTVTANFAAISGTVASAVAASDPAPAIGEQIVVSINVDLSGIVPSRTRLGSLTGSLAWDPTVLSYVTNSGLLAGFTSDVDISAAAAGRFAFSGANPTGVRGSGTAITITLSAVGAGATSLDLEYSAMSAAYSFTDLLPRLTITDGEVVVSAAAQ